MRVSEVVALEKKKLLHIIFVTLTEFESADLSTGAVHKSMHFVFCKL